LEANETVRVLEPKDALEMPELNGVPPELTVYHRIKPKVKLVDVDTNSTSPVPQR
jgi:hypothetical protein